MTSGEALSRTSLWVFRSLALGSTVAVGMHIIPHLSVASGQQAIQLAGSDELVYAREGVRRMGRNARKGEKQAKELIELGAVQILGDAMERGDERLFEAALVSGAQLVRNDQKQILKHNAFRQALGQSECGSGCKIFCKTVGLQGFGLEERLRMLDCMDGDA